jgi:site-specific recombinase XerD
MKLYYTDESFVVVGLARPGVPFLCDEDMELMTVPNRYLEFIAVVKGRTRSPNTWSTYAEALFEFFAFAESNELDWTDLEPAHVAAWRDTQLGRGNKESTVTQRLGIVHRFFRWAVAKNLVPQLPYDLEEVSVAKGQPFLSHTDATKAKSLVSDIGLKAPRAVPKFLLIDQAITFLDALTPHRLRLMGYLMLLTGMRREEVVELNLEVLPNPAGRPAGRALDMVLDPALTRTKGNVERVVKVPYLLGEMLYSYLTWERPKLARQYKKTHGAESKNLFLSEMGEELSIDGLTTAFHSESKKVGIKCHPHMLRHTFATYELLRVSAKQGDVRALHWVRDRLGHASLVTTERYLHTAALLKHDDAVDGYVADVCKALAHGT